MSAHLESLLSPSQRADAAAWDAKAHAALVSDARTDFDQALGNPLQSAFFTNTPGAVQSFELDDRAQLAEEVGRLTAEVRKLRDELAFMQGKGQRPQRGCEFSEQCLEDATVLVEYEYIREEDPIYDVDYPGVGPGHDAEVNVIQVLINGAWVDPHDCIAESVIERWEQQILEEVSE